MSPRIALSVQSGEWERVNYPAEVVLEPGSAPIQVIETDAQGNVIDDAVPFQLDAEASGGWTLTFLLTGKTPAHTERHFALASATAVPIFDSLVKCIDGVVHQEQESYRIETASATYLYHKYGAGFASLYDADGCDWISYRPFGGSDGKYRGIPNLAHPENYFHPGGTGCVSEVISSGPLKVKIASRSNDGIWSCTWEIFPSHVRMAVLGVGHPYWFLYEGTPGGQLDESGDFCVRSDGKRHSLAEPWHTPLPAPEWIYFGSSSSRRALYLAHHEADSHVDAYWPMEHNMTVFGFGRNGLKKYMTDIPSHFSIGLLETSDFSHAQPIINAVLQPIEVSVRVS